MPAFSQHRRLWFSLFSTLLSISGEAAGIMQVKIPRTLLFLRWTFGWCLECWRFVSASLPVLLCFSGSMDFEFFTTAAPLKCLYVCWSAMKKCFIFKYSCKMIGGYLWQWFTLKHLNFQKKIAFPLLQQSLCHPDWPGTGCPWTHRHPPASAFQGLGLKMCSITSGKKMNLKEWCMYISWVCQCVVWTWNVLSGDNNICFSRYLTNTSLKVYVGYLRKNWIVGNLF